MTFNATHHYYLLGMLLLFLSEIAIAADEAGVTGSTIVIGQSAAFSGPAAKLGESMQEGAMVYFDEVNRQGGVHGRKIELISLDDGYEPDRATSNTRKLIDNDKVFALFGYVGTPTSYAVMPIITEAKIPFFGAFTGAEGLRTPLNRYIFNVRASYFDETEKLVDWLVSQRKQRVKKIAVFYQDDAYGQAGLAGVARAMDKRGLKIAATGTVKRNTVDVADAVKEINEVNPDAVIMISAYKSCAEFIRQAQRAGRETLYLNVSFVGSEALASELGPDGNGVIISQVVPYPADPSFGIAMQFTLALKRYRPDSKPSFNNLEGYIAAKAFVEGLQRAGRDLTREKFIAALESFRDVDLGNFYVSFSPDSHNGSRLVILTLIAGSHGSFMPFQKTAAAASQKK